MQTSTPKRPLTKYSGYSLTAITCGGCAHPVQHAGTTVTGLVVRHGTCCHSKGYIVGWIARLGIPCHYDRPVVSCLGRRVENLQSLWTTVRDSLKLGR